MARFDVSGIDDIIHAFEKLNEDIGPMADEMLMKSAAIVKECWRGAAEQAGHRDTGSMIDSIGYARSPKKVKDIRLIDIYPQGKDKRGTRNAAKAFTLHYGTKKMRGSRFVTVADTRSAPRIEKVFKDGYEKLLKKEGLL